MATSATSATFARLNQPVASPGELRSYFFNGRLLTAEDLTREQALREGGDARLARLIGCGVAEGLAVTAAGAGRVLIQPGLGVTPSGLVIEAGLIDLDLSAAGKSSSFGGFGNCAAGLAEGQPLAGLYYLVLTASWIPQGRAATLLGEVGACNRRTEAPAVRARLVEVQPPTGLPGVSPRSSLAVALLSPGQGLAAVTPGSRLGWWPRQRQGATDAAAPGLTADDLPIALLQMDSQARVQWLDMDSARRRLSPPPGSAADADWPQSWAVEMQAFAAQFVNHLGQAQSGAELAWLPPVAPLDRAQATRLRALLPRRLPASPQVLGRAAFAQALMTGWQDEPQPTATGELHLAQLAGHPDRLLLRATVRGERDAVAAEGGGDGDGDGDGEVTSRRVASMAAKLLREGQRHRDGGPSAAELSIAGSALTQAPDRRPRKSRASPRPAPK